MKSTIKTAISIDTETFNKVEQLSRKLHMSRSQFFTQAAQYMITHDENIELLRRIDASYEEDSSETQRREAEKGNYRDRIEKW